MELREFNDTCKMCGSYVSTVRGLAMHLRFHGVLSKDYYDKFVKKDGEGICINCGVGTKFVGFKYQLFCGNRCNRKYTWVQERGTGKYVSSLFGKGNVPWNAGKGGYVGSPCWSKGLTKETNKSLMKLSAAFKGRLPWNTGTIGHCAGEKNYFWKGGISYELYGVEYNKRLRKRVLERDGYICRECGASNIEIGLCCHHIDYNKKNNSIINLITLCVSCHARTNSNRLHWTSRYQLMNSPAALLEFKNEECLT